MVLNSMMYLLTILTGFGIEELVPYVQLQSQLSLVYESESIGKTNLSTPSLINELHPNAVHEPLVVPLQLICISCEKSGTMHVMLHGSPFTA